MGLFEEAQRNLENAEFAVAAIETLRHGRRHVDETPLPANREIVLEGVEGDDEDAAEADSEGEGSAEE